MATIDRQSLRRALMDALYDAPPAILEWLPRNEVADRLADAVGRVLAAHEESDELSVTIEPGRERLVFANGLGGSYEPADDDEGLLFDSDRSGMSARQRAVLRGLLGLALKRLDEYERPPRPPLGGLLTPATSSGDPVAPTNWRIGGEPS